MFNNHVGMIVWVLNSTLLKAEKFLTREDAKAIVEESIQPVQKNVTKIQSTCDETNILLQNFITQFKVFQAVEEYKEKQERKDE